MEFYRRDLRHGNQALHVVDLQIGLAVTVDHRLLDPPGQAPRRVALKPFFMVDTVRRANDRAGAPFEMRDHPGPDAFEIAGEFEFRHRAAPLCGRPQFLFGP